jgi:hypothetical protein
MDQVTLNGRDIHNDNPAERMSYHGVMNATQNRYKGLNFGYPSCVPAWDTNIGINGLLVGSLFKPDGVPNVNADDCANNRMTGRLHFNPHTAPLDIKFNKDSTSAYIAFHGSWYVTTHPAPSPKLFMVLTELEKEPQPRRRLPRHARRLQGRPARARRHQQDGPGARHGEQQHRRLPPELLPPHGAEL